MQELISQHGGHEVICYKAGEYKQEWLREHPGLELPDWLKGKNDDEIVHIQK